MYPKTILLVDDDICILNSLHRLLRKEKYNLLTASNGEYALRLLVHQPVHLVIADQRMPNMDGAVFLEKVKQQSPATVRVMLSGYTDTLALLDALVKGAIYRFIPKPWDNADLKNTISQCLKHYDAVTQFSSSRVSSLKKADLELLETSSCRSLDDVRDILEHLPIPMMAVDSQGGLLFSNNHLNKRFPEFKDCLLTECNISQIFPLNLSSLTASSPEEYNFIHLPNITYKNHNFVLHGSLLNTIEYPACYILALKEV